LKAQRVSRQKSVYLACFILHFLLIITVSCRETLWLVARGLTICSAPFDGYAQKAEGIAAAALGQHLAASNPVRQTLASYMGIAGIDAGYGYFAPNVPSNYKLVFELHYPDGHTEYQLPRVNSAAAGLRIASLLEQIGRTRSDALREHVVKTLARSVWREQPEVKTIRALLGKMVQPTIADFERGKKESYELLYAYDFSLGSDSAEPSNQ
jgi:hypothetical protein